MKIQYSIFTIICVLLLASIVDGAENEHRIVSLAPSNTAQVCDLGLGGDVVGITKFCTRPDNATDAVIIGTLSQPNLELIVTLEPTLILGDVESNRPETLDQLEDLGFQVLRLGPSQDLESILRDYMKIAEFLGREEHAKTYVQNLKLRLETIRQALKNETYKRVFIEVWPKPLMTVSKKGFIHHVVVAAGGSNVFVDAPVAYPQISLESVIAKNPEVILILTHSLIDDARVKRYREFPEFNNSLIRQTDASELSQPSPSAFLKASEYFLQILHPGLSSQLDEENSNAIKAD